MKKLVCCLLVSLLISLTFGKEYIRQWHRIDYTYKHNIESLFEHCSPMEQEFRVWISKGYFQHCQDPHIKNTFDISVRSLKNHKEFFRVAKEYKNVNQGFDIIDERRNQAPCYHIEITQP